MTTDFKHTKAKINKAIKQSVDSKKVLNKVAEQVTKNVKANTREGIDYKGKKFAGLADSSIEQRDYLADYNRTHADYSSGRSNATLTGELVDAIGFEVKNEKITIEAKGTHRAYKGKRGKYKHTSSHADILNALWDLGRKIMGLSKTARKKAVVEIKREFRRSLTNNK